MQSVYENAELTFAAAEADIPHRALIRPFVPSIQAKLEGHPIDATMQDHIPTTPIREPPFARAWTLQGGLLSRRAVYLNGEQLRWQRACSRAYEDAIYDPIHNLYQLSRLRVVNRGLDFGKGSNF
jgi:hypothetical protein